MNRGVYRIIDANFNRAREALRVMEEFCRFVLNSEKLTARAKELRHELVSISRKLDSGQMIAGRDTLSDVGVGTTVENQLQRNSINDCFKAACNRLSEALRTLAEMTQLLQPSVSNAVEQLRYCAYTLEKDIIIFSDTFEKFKSVKLYVIISGQLPLDTISLAQQCIQGGADCIQLRAKGISDDKYFALASELVQLCKNAGLISIINDRVDIAVAADADGVHIGQTDLSVEQARKLQLKPLIVGKSTHSVIQLKAAIEEQPTYVALGPVFSTTTKPEAEAVGLDYVGNSKELLAGTGIRSVAIGGINLQNVEDVLKAGADVIAACSAVTEAKDPTEACRKLKAEFAVLDKR